jgi:dTDP-4-dehydrorhamnose reductase
MGQLARSLVQAARRRGTELVTAGRPELDLAQPESLARAIEAHAPRAVVNAAAYTAVDKAEAEAQA